MDQILITAEWLKEQPNDPRLHLLDVRASDPRLPIGYRMGHIPNAMPFDLARDAYHHGAGLPTLKSPEALAEALAARGISNDSTIVVYDENIGPLTGAIFWLLKYLGHRDVRTLNGGWPAWKRAGGPIERETPTPAPGAYAAQLDARYFANADWIQANAPRDDLVLLDTRTDGEYYMGHIPNAVNLSFDAAMDHTSEMLKSRDELRKQFEEIGVTPDKEILTYCGSGSRSAHTFLVLKSLDYPRVRNYLGSMLDWVQMRGLPIE